MSFLLANVLIGEPAATPIKSGRTLAGTCPLDAHACRLDHLGPPGALGAANAANASGVIGAGSPPTLAKRGHHLRLAEDALHLGGDLVDDQARRAASA
jgi:hypothetical protein